MAANPSPALCRNAPPEHRVDHICVWPEPYGLSGRKVLAVLTMIHSYQPTPVVQYRYLVGQNLDADRLDPRLVGAKMWWHEGRGWQGRAYLGNGSWLEMDWTGAKHVTVEVPVPRPRNGREYGWEWDQWRGWSKAHFPRCTLCRGYHDPDVPLCIECGWCMPAHHAACRGCGLLSKRLLKDASRCHVPSCSGYVKAGGWSCDRDAHHPV